MVHETIILALNGLVNEQMATVLTALGDPKAERNLVVNIDSPLQTGHQKNGEEEWQQKVYFSPCPFEQSTIGFIYWFGNKNKNLRWEISFIDGGGSDGLKNSLYDALDTTLKYMLKWKINRR